MAFFITLEGPEGAGKSTQMRHLAAVLGARGYQVVCTREPGGCPAADAIRSILLSPTYTGLDPTTELLLYAAARAQHVQEVIRPALADGAVVLCDRFADATRAYQGYGRGLDRTLIEQTNALATAGLEPDLTLLFDLPVDQGLERARQRQQTGGAPDEDRFEREQMTFHQRVRDGYLDLARQAPDRFRVIDATASVDAVTTALTGVLEAWLEEHRGI